MTHAEPIHHRHRHHPGLLLGLLLAAALGFAAGQTWPQDMPQAEAQRPVLEDWHGNVRRSYWAE